MYIYPNYPLFVSRLKMYTPIRIRREKTTLSTNSDSDKEPVKVYCRLRPPKDENAMPYMKLISPQEILVTSESKGLRKQMCYKFKHVFTAFSTQKEVFDHLAFPLVEDLLKGKNGLLFTYGVTGSGKTFTVMGDQANPGIMPRCINAIFNSIGDFQTPKFIIKPDKMNGFEIQTEDDAVQDRVTEVRTINRTPKSTKKGSSNEKLTFSNDGTRVPILNETTLFAVFITYVEIYNNNVFDLLDGTGNGTRLQNKILREDSNRNMYVNGVVEVEVKNSQEAFELLSAGQRRKKVAHTILNAESSRSHSVFNIRVVQLNKETVNGDGKAIIPEKNMIQIGQLSLVDLAGSERSSRTQNTGTRLKEASCINNSLMSLRTCLEILRENQKSKSNKVVPYRDSRLTFLFKNYFEGDGSVQMVVCVNPTLEDMEENLHVMKFAEMSQDVKVTKSEPKYTPIGIKKTISKRKATPARIAAVSNFSVLSDIKAFQFTDNIEECGLRIDNLIQNLRQNKTRRENVLREYNESHQDFRKKLVKVNENYILKVNEVSSVLQINNKQRQKIYNLETKISDLETVNDSLAHKNEELQNVIRTLHHTVKEKDLRINQNQLEREKAKQRAALNIEKMSQELDVKLKKQRDHLNAAMKVKDIQLRKVKEALESEVVVKPGQEPETDENVPPQIPQSPSMSTYRRNAAATGTPRSRRRSRSAGEVSHYC